ncbi:MAG TPA: hypothetical protein VJQ06_09935 [Rhizomicrobium sp.]|nr:hypothetical protein [Rhizomicrobium sp.]
MNVKAMLGTLFLATGTVIAAPAPDPAATEPGHLVSPAGGAKGAVTRQQFEMRFETSAAGPLMGGAGTRADRFAAFDIAWPRDVEEAKRLGGNTVILLGALSRNVSELPLAKVYLERPDGSQVVLRRLGRVKRTLAASSQAAKVFGPNLTEEFYLVPVHALGRNVMLKCDFAKNRLGFVVSHSLSSASPVVQSPAVRPLAGAVQAMVEREYPGFGISFMGNAK